MDCTKVMVSIEEAIAVLKCCAQMELSLGVDVILDDQVRRLERAVDILEELGSGEA